MDDARRALIREARDDGDLDLAEAAELVDELHPTLAVESTRERHGKPMAIDWRDVDDAQLVRLWTALVESRARETRDAIGAPFDVDAAYPGLRDAAVDAARRLRGVMRRWG